MTTMPAALLMIWLSLHLEPGFGRQDSRNLAYGLGPAARHLSESINLPVHSSCRPRAENFIRTLTRRSHTGKHMLLRLTQREI